jgi:hypothetical protein
LNPLTKFAAFTAPREVLLYDDGIGKFGGIPNANSAQAFTVALLEKKDETPLEVVITAP